VYGGRDLVSLARPKSAILTSSGPVHSKFSGFMSRWKNPVQENFLITKALNFVKCHHDLIFLFYR